MRPSTGRRTRRVLQSGLALLFGFGVTFGAVQASDSAAPKSARDGDLLGSLEFDVYCKAAFGSRALAFVTTTDVFRWQCATMANRVFNVSDIANDEACDVLFGGPAFAVAFDPTWPYSWECFRGDAP